MRHLTALVSIALALSIAAPGSALAADPDPAPAAKEQFQQGREAFKRGDFSAALALFQKSQDTLPTPGTLLNLALCEEQLGMTATAWQHFVDLSGQLASSDERYAVVKQHQTALEPRVSRLTIDLAPGVPPGTSVTRDRIAVAGTNLGTSLPVDPGKHAIAVSAPGRSVRVFQVTLAEGKQEVIKVEPGPPIAPTAGPLGQTAEGASTSAARTSPPPPQSSGARTAGFVIGGIGLAGLALGGVTGVLTILKTSDVEAACPVPDRCTTDGVAIADSARTFGLISSIAFAAGAAGVGVGVVLLITSKRGEPEPPTAISPVALPGGAGLALRRSF